MSSSLHNEPAGLVVFYIACESYFAGHTSAFQKLHLIMQRLHELKSGICYPLDMHYYIQEKKAETECYTILR